ncbi:MAG: hypothetical protein M1835_007391 [Candelina submexicana]|nr:MAG: hypothetical protein M1835_007391 [Candelina submexicana]
MSQIPTSTYPYLALSPPSPTPARSTLLRLSLPPLLVPKDSPQPQPPFSNITLSSPPRPPPHVFPQRTAILQSRAETLPTYYATGQNRFDDEEMADLPADNFLSFALEYLKAMQKDMMRILEDAGRAGYPRPNSDDGEFWLAKFKGR